MNRVRIFIDVDFDKNWDGPFSEKRLTVAFEEELQLFKN